MKKNNIVLLVAILAIVTLIGIKLLNTENKSDKKSKQGAPVAIDVVIIKEKPFSQIVQTKGSLLANEQVEIRNEVSGKIESINFTEGQFCKIGQLLIKINDDELRSQLKKAEQSFKLSKDLLERQKAMYDKGGTSKSDLDKLQNENDNLNEEVKRLKDAIEKTSVFSPFEGRVGLRNHSVGAYLVANTLITNVVNTDPIKIEFSVPEKYANRINENSEITFKVAGDTLVYKANVFATDALIDNATRSLKVKAKTNNSKNKLLVGSYASIFYEIKNESASISIPTQAIVPILKGQKVFVVNNGKATEKIVNTGFRSDAEIEITNGLSVGDTVIVNGVVQIKNGAPVKINKYL
ncbi:MAG: efflux RND transporter periplasmic adaptor subunit [Bacteroidota bacterium]